eukprot:jgi/Chlat1/3914/Chrsp26S00306
MDLLFADTFAHDRHGDNVDEARFDEDVLIQCCRIVPAGAQVHTELRDVVGATTAGEFHLSLYARNNLQTSDRFVQLCALTNESLTSNKFTPLVTSHLVVRGQYKDVTIALFGIRVPRAESASAQVENKLEELQSHMPTALQPAEQLPSRPQLQVLRFCQQRPVDLPAVAVDALIAAVHSWRAARAGDGVSGCDTQTLQSLQTAADACEDTDFEHIAEGSGDWNCIQDDAIKMVFDWLATGFDGGPPVGSSSVNNVAGALAGAALLCSSTRTACHFVSAGGVSALLDVVSSPSSTAAMLVQALRALNIAARDAVTCEALLGWWPVQASQDGEVKPNKEMPASIIDRPLPAAGYQALLRVLQHQGRKAPVLCSRLLRHLRVYELATSVDVHLQVLLQPANSSTIKEHVAKACTSLHSLTVVLSGKSVEHPSTSLLRKRFQETHAPWSRSSADDNVQFQAFAVLLERRMLSLLGAALHSLSTSDTGLDSEVRRFVAALLQTPSGMLFLVSDVTATNAIASYFTHHARAQHRAVGASLSTSVAVLVASDQLLATSDDAEEKLQMMRQMLHFARDSDGRLALAMALQLPALQDAFVQLIIGGHPPAPSTAQPVLAHVAASLLLELAQNGDSQSWLTWLQLAPRLHAAMSQEQPSSGTRGDKGANSSGVERGTTASDAASGVETVALPTEFIQQLREWLRPVVIFQSKGLGALLQHLDKMLSESAGPEEKAKALAAKGTISTPYPRAVTHEATACFRLLTTLPADRVVMGQPSLGVFVGTLIPVLQRMAAFFTHAFTSISESSPPEVALVVLDASSSTKRMLFLAAAAAAVVGRCMQQVQQTVQEYRNTKLVNALLALYLAISSWDSHAQQPPDVRKALQETRYQLAATLAFWFASAWQPSVLQRLLEEKYAAPAEMYAIVQLLTAWLPPATKVPVQPATAASAYQLRSVAEPLQPALAALAALLQRMASTTSRTLQRALVALSLRLLCVSTAAAVIAAQALVGSLPHAESPEEELAALLTAQNVPHVTAVLQLLFVLAKHPIGKAFLLEAGAVQAVLPLLGGFHSTTTGTDVADSNNIASVQHLAVQTLQRLVNASNVAQIASDADSIPSADDTTAVASSLLQFLSHAADDAAMGALSALRDLVAHPLGVSCFVSAAQHTSAIPVLSAQAPDAISPAAPMDGVVKVDGTDTSPMLDGEEAVQAPTDSVVEKLSGPVVTFLEAMAARLRSSGGSATAVVGLIESFCSFAVHVLSHDVSSGCTKAMRHLLHWDSARWSPAQQHPLVLMQDMVASEHVKQQIRQIIIAAMEDNASNCIEWPALTEFPPRQATAAVFKKIESNAVHAIDSRVRKAAWDVQLQWASSAFTSTTEDHNEFDTCNAPLHGSLSWDCTAPIEPPKHAKRKLATVSLPESKRANIQESESTGNRPAPQAGQRRDQFRARKPNTSRPASMHVDDFEKRSAPGANAGAGQSHRTGGGRPPSLHVDEFMAREKERQMANNKPTTPSQPASIPASTTTSLAANPAVTAGTPAAQQRTQPPAQQPSPQPLLEEGKAKASEPVIAAQASATMPMLQRAESVKESMPAAAQNEQGTFRKGRPPSPPPATPKATPDVGAPPDLQQASGSPRGFPLTGGFGGYMPGLGPLPGLGPGMFGPRPPGGSGLGPQPGPGQMPLGQGFIGAPGHGPGHGPGAMGLEPMPGPMPARSTGPGQPHIPTPGGMFPPRPEAFRPPRYDFRPAPPAMIQAEGQRPMDQRPPPPPFQQQQQQRPMHQRPPPPPFHQQQQTPIDQRPSPPPFHHQQQTPMHQRPPPPPFQQQQQQHFHMHLDREREQQEEQRGQHAQEELQHDSDRRMHHHQQQQQQQQHMWLRQQEEQEEEQRRHQQYEREQEQRRQQQGFGRTLPPGPPAGPPPPSGPVQQQQQRPQPFQRPPSPSMQDSPFPESLFVQQAHHPLHGLQSRPPNMSDEWRPPPPPLRAQSERPAPEAQGYRHAGGDSPHAGQMWPPRPSFSASDRPTFPGAASRAPLQSAAPAPSHDRLQPQAPMKQHGHAQPASIQYQPQQQMQHQHQQPVPSPAPSAQRPTDFTPSQQYQPQQAPSVIQTSLSSQHLVQQTPQRPPPPPQFQSQPPVQPQQAAAVAGDLQGLLRILSDPQAVKDLLADKTRLVQLLKDYPQLTTLLQAQMKAT